MTVAQPHFQCKKESKVTLTWAMDSELSDPKREQPNMEKKVKKKTRRMP